MVSLVASLGAFLRPTVSLVQGKHLKASAPPSGPLRPGLIPTQGAGRTKGGSPLRTGCLSAGRNPIGLPALMTWIMAPGHCSLGASISSPFWRRNERGLPCNPRLFQFHQVAQGRVSGLGTTPMPSICPKEAKAGLPVLWRGVPELWRWNPGRTASRERSELQWDRMPSSPPPEVPQTLTEEALGQREKWRKGRGPATLWPRPAPPGICLQGLGSSSRLGLRLGRKDGGCEHNT